MERKTHGQLKSSSLEEAVWPMGKTERAQKGSLLQRQDLKLEAVPAPMHLRPVASLPRGKRMGPMEILAPASDGSHTDPSTSRQARE